MRNYILIKHCQRSDTNDRWHKCDQIGRFIWTLGKFLTPFATIKLPKSPTFLGNFCKGVKIYHFSSEINFWATFIDILGFFSGHTGWHHWYNNIGWWLAAIWEVFNWRLCIEFSIDNCQFCLCVFAELKYHCENINCGAVKLRAG